MATTSRLDQLTGEYVIDPARTRIGFVVRSTKITKVRGWFERFDGVVQLDGDDPTKSSVRLTLQAASIQTRNRRRDDHLRREFLAVEAHPTITFASTAIRAEGSSTFMITGDLTIRGAVKPVAVTVELTRTDHDPAGGFRVGFVGRASVNRKDWGVRMISALDNGSFVIDDRVDLLLEVSAGRRI
ncbi:YceI family protein [Microlunatus speluncae]|uniref:YceI family protein n=1 Tax=Microlunatus speluncae TaxID=2594267 RepID=UPI0012666C44|nr:YceI family protein [Microlunatus speluncae]